MAAPRISERFAELEGPQPVEAYNFEHFRVTHLAADANATLRARGIRPGAEAPDFELRRVDGGTLRLSELRGGPVLLRFGSRT
ncbi:MAG TPA: hypothetical protein VF212_13945 [Longimicrobiales bacterium]